MTIGWIGKSKLPSARQMLKPRSPEKYVHKDPILPMELKDTVKGNAGRSKKVPCANELVEMLECLKRTGFSEGACKAAITSYAECNKEVARATKEKESRAEEDLSLMTNPRDMGKMQIRQLLKPFPNK